MLLGLGAQSSSAAPFEDVNDLLDKSVVREADRSWKEATDAGTDINVEKVNDMSLIPYNLYNMIIYI